MDALRERIIRTIHETADAQGIELVPDLADETVLLHSGLDSLGFAVLVARLEEDLGYDPFVMMSDPVYPRTLGEFIAVYRQLEPRPAAE